MKRLSPPAETWQHTTRARGFENRIFHELSAFVSCREVNEDLSYWRLPSGIEVDFILGEARLAVEAKATLKEEHPGVERRIVVSLEARPRRADDGIDILPANTFAERLWHGEFAGQLPGAADQPPLTAGSCRRSGSSTAR